MYFVINTMSKKEDEMLNRIKKSINENIYSEMFIVKRKRLRKKEGSWLEYEEKIFPGYIFVETDKPKEFASILRRIEGFKRLVGTGDIGYMTYLPLVEDEEKMINDLIGKESKTIDLSYIKIDEGRNFKIISGPLCGYEGKVIKYDLHKKTALISIPFASRETSVQVGIDIIREN